MIYAFHPQAVKELLDAIDQYENYEPGLGTDFAIEVHSAIENIQSFPMAWPIIAGDIRRCQLRRFPYGILYSLENDVIYILAVMHLHRDPEYWKDREK